MYITGLELAGGRAGLAPVNTPFMLLVLSSPASASWPLWSRREIALFYGMEKRGDKKKKEEPGRREKKGVDGAKKGP